MFVAMIPGMVKGDGTSMTLGFVGSLAAVAVLSRRRRLGSLVLSKRELVFAILKASGVSRKGWARQIQWLNKFSIEQMQTILDELQRSVSA